MNQTEGNNKVRRVPCCERDFDADGNCDRHPNGVFVDAEEARAVAVSLTLLTADVYERAVANATAKGVTLEELLRVAAEKIANGRDIDSARAGGKARWRNSTPEQRSEYGRMLAKARWKKDA